MQDQNLVLVVDDDPGILKGVQRLLRQHAYEPILFSSAEAFKNHTDFEGAACVILDINLKDGSGIDLGYRLKADRIFVPVIYISGNRDPAVRKAALDSGCIAFLTKPFSAQELIEPLKRGWQASPTAEARSNAPVSCHAPGGSGVPPRIALVRKFNRANGDMRRPPFQFAVAA